jgi:guanylate kinase
MSLNRKGMLIVLSAPSGTGKTTIADALHKQDKSILRSIATTTRDPRPGEIDGDHYHFVSETEFLKKIEDGAMAEYVRIHDHFYGTTKEIVDSALLDGQDVMFVIDRGGYKQLRNGYEKDLFSILLLPPSLKELERRLRNRDLTVPEEFVQQRLSTVADEISDWQWYDYVVINENLTKSVQDIYAIIEAERMKKHRCLDIASFIKELS